ncbi:DUF4846 domain-containing protein [Myxococcota bacterium]|nr:DUF4846 domain-containing protein [Myxococcota bacterium]MBU1512207.1 DUF4846 domain-containing protein [Myxococcota bacterium]
MKSRIFIAAALALLVVAAAACNGRTSTRNPAPAPVTPITEPAGPTPPPVIATPVAPTPPEPPPPPPADLPDAAAVAKWYPWPRSAAAYESLAQRTNPPPKGFSRVPAAIGSYAWWLRHLPVLAPGEPLRYHDGSLVPRGNSGVTAIVDLDTGRRDLQQCMDVLIRLRAEYLRAAGLERRISFRYTGGRYFSWSSWQKGLRPDRTTPDLKLVPKAAWSDSRGSFMGYLQTLFYDTGTMHHQNEPAVAPAELAIGDFFVYPPISSTQNGHAVIVLDLAVSATGERRIVVAQGDTPATDLHVLKTPRRGTYGDPGTSWFVVPAGDFTGTFLWPTPFSWDMLRRFRY